MSSNLIPERPLLISPTLASTIGLDEAVMLHVISEMQLQLNTIARAELTWVETDAEMLGKWLPFWKSDKIRQVQQNLQEKGLLQIDMTAPGKIILAINKPGMPKPAAATRPAPQKCQQTAGISSGRATQIAEDWRPSEDLYALCAQRNIPRQYIDERIRLFIISQQERRRAQYSWHNVFYKYILREWENSRAHKNLKELEATMTADWQPGEDALSILEHAGINHSFIEDAVPEFVLYWRETGLKTSTWNTKFIAHVRRQWAKFEVALEHDTTPKLLPEDYQPSEEVFEVLEMANIDPQFAQELIPEFILYWRERKEVSASWHTKFLQHVKYKWSHRTEEKGDFIERVTDRSWAS
ncbi:MAG: DnaT-like ssDNA-binding domain-containing protein [Gammaproteobacteria bacterium]